MAISDWATWDDFAAYDRDVGDFIAGYGDGAYEFVEGVGYVIWNPWQTTKHIATAEWGPTVDAIKNHYVAKSKTWRGWGAIGWDISSLVLTGGGGASAQASGKAGKLSSMLGSLENVAIKTEQVVGKSEQIVVKAEQIVPRSLVSEAEVQSLRAATELRTQLEASSAFTPEGALSQSGLVGSKPIISWARLGNKASIPQGCDKWATRVFDSPSGGFEVHFYKNSATGEIWYQLDYKSKFVKELGGSQGAIK